MSPGPVKPTILVVDDAPENIWTLIKSLEKDYETLYATSGQKALEVAFSKDRPDLILLDIVMPGMSGYEVLQQLKAEETTANIPVIFLTAKTEEADETHGLDLGAWDYITKPFSMPVVRARVQSVLNLKREMDRRMFLKEQMESLNVQLENQVQVKIRELEEIRETLRASEERYRGLFERGAPSAEGPRKVLVVDDNPENIHVLAKNLEDDYEVLYATSGEKALSIAFSGERLDLILLDIMMPGMDGYEVCGRLKANAETWDIPVIFITAMSQTEDESRGLELGAADYIAKPFSVPIVRARVGAALRLKVEMDKRLMLTQKLASLNQDLEGRVTEKVAELKQAHADLKISELKYRTIFENAVEGIWQSTPEGRFLSASPSMAEIFGYDSPEELMAKVSDIGHQCYDAPEDRDKLLTSLREKGVVKGMEVRMKRRDGSILWASVSGRLVEGGAGGGRYIEGFCMDISRQKLAEEALRVNEAQLRQAQKMEAMGTLASGIAHDFNNILSPIMGYTEMCIDRLPEERAERGYLEEVLKATQRAQGLVSRILAFSRGAERERKPIEVKPVVGEVAKLLQSAFPASIEIRQDIRSGGRVLADPVEIHQVVMNLCTNALFAMDEEAGGVVGLSVIDVTVREGDLKYPALPPGPYVRLAVTDTGQGISPEVQEKIFEPYFTTKSKGEGTGLGLASVLGIVNDLSGQIFVDSAVGEGTTFTLYFPRVDDAPGAGRPQIPGSGRSGDHEHILLADDEKQIREMMGLMLESLGYRITAYPTAVEALAAFKAAPDGFDLVMTDMTMPKMSGVEFAGKVLAERPDLPVIVLTGFSEKIDMEKARRLGIRDLVRKPVSRSQIASAIKKALA